jgi:hypothetical protein
MSLARRLQATAVRERWGTFQDVEDGVGADPLAASAAVCQFRIRWRFQAEISAQPIECFQLSHHSRSGYFIPQDLDV